MNTDTERAEHTAGPWHFVHDHERTRFEIETVEQEFGIERGGYRHITNNMPMGVAHGRKPDDMAECGCSKEQLANARPIAAAPAWREAGHEAWDALADILEDPGVGRFLNDDLRERAMKAVESLAMVEARTVGRAEGADQ